MSSMSEYAELKKFTCKECDCEFYMDNELFHDPIFCPYCGMEFQEGGTNE